MPRNPKGPGNNLGKLPGYNSSGKRPSAKDIMNKYGKKIQGQIEEDSGSAGEIKSNYSRVYTSFKSELYPNLSRYEKWCKSLGSIIKVTPSEKDKKDVEKYLDIAHLDVEAWQALTLAITSFVFSFLSGLLISVGYALLHEGSFINNFPILFFILVVAFSSFLFYFVKKYPQRLATKWRLKASSQMVPAILYIVVYMRHTPNLEKAVSFASQHLDYPLALDFKKMFYNVEVGKYSNIQQSLEAYLETWRDYSTEFVESFHLIESSLYEPDDSRRVSTLEKSLKVVLDGIYDKMLKFTHNVRSPLTNVYMLGVILPTLGLALMPLASIMLQEVLNFVHVFLLFNLVVPFSVYYLTDKILLKRPGGHGETSLLERNPLYHKYKSKKPYVVSFIFSLPLLIIGFLPLIFQYTPIPRLLNLKKDYTFAELGLSFLGDKEIFHFVEVEGSAVGPFGFSALLFGLFIPIGIAFFFSHAYKAKTKEIMKYREKTDQLEKEFNNSLFQLGNRLGNGTPPELVFSKVIQSSKGLMTENFFKTINYNIQQMGMSVEDSIFDNRRGAMKYYPSQLISTSMRILIESSKKGLKVAATSLMSISEYTKKINKITQRLRDMLAKIVSDMKSNMTFLAPLLSGIVVGLAAMITEILRNLKLPEFTGKSIGGFGQVSQITQMFDYTAMVPPYFIQIAVGIYIIEIVFILTGTLISVNSGQDKLQKTRETGRNLVKGVMLYFITSFVAVLALAMLANFVLKGMG